MKSETTGFTIKDDKYYCEKCGCDEFEPMTHTDATTYYSQSYRCTKCAAICTITKERSYDQNKFKINAPQEKIDGAKKVIWREDMSYCSFQDKAYSVLMPECPTCHEYPTYNLLQCPYCGENIDYTEVE